MRPATARSVSTEIGDRVLIGVCLSMTIADQPNSALISLVTPAYNEEGNLPVLYSQLVEVLDTMKADWEWVIVDDHSADATFQVILDLAGKDARVRGVRFARNAGSHVAIACGLDLVRGDCAIILAGDLQDPPATLPELVEKWREGSQVVWAVRGHREGEQTSTLASARLYYWLMRNVVGMKEMSAEGADFLLMDRQVIEAFRQFRESNLSILALVSWMGFRQTRLTYTKQARLHGRSGWTLPRKMKLLADSVTAFSYAPMRLMSYVGLATAAIGFLYSAILLANGIMGRPVPGWTSLMMVVLVVGGIQMVMMGVLGEYLWRALDESRRRPRYLVERVTGEPPADTAETARRRAGPAS